MPLKLIKHGNSKNWILRGTIAGQRIHKSTGTSDKQAAEKIRIRTEADALERASLGVKATITFAEAALNYLQSGREGRFLAPILKHFGDRTKLKDIDTAAINAAAAKIYPDAAPATINRQLITPVRAVITMAAEDGLCSPIKLRGRRVTAKKTRWLTPEEFERLTSEMTPHLTQIVGFMIGTGARVRETLTLQMSTLYLASGQALLTETKNEKARMVRIPDRAAKMIGTRNLPEAGAVFTTDHGKPYAIKADHHGKKIGASIKTAFYRARDAAGLEATGQDKVTPHTIRHTWATWHYAQNRDFGELLDLGGWSTADVANIYRKIAPDDLAERLLAHGWDFRRSGRTDTMQPANLRLVR